MTNRSPHHQPSNAQRALWAKAALTVFTAETYGGDHPDSMDRGDLETAISDLICDLLHFACLHPSMDSAEIHAHALRLFEQEIADDEVCDCADRSWYGSYHDTQCPAHPLISRAKRQKELAPELFRTSGSHRAVLWIDGRFQIEIHRNPPPPRASAQLIFKIYPITDGEVWDEPYKVFDVDEGRIIELETQARE